MKYPHKKIVTTKKEYWDCGRGHNHLTEQVAFKCYEKFKEKFKNRTPNKELHAHGKRNLAIVNDVLNKGNLSATARNFGLSRSKVDRLFRLYIRKAKFMLYREQTEKNGVYLRWLTYRKAMYWEEGLIDRLRKHKQWQD